MKKIFLLVVISWVVAQTAIAQQIKPYDLIQLYKYSQLKEDQYGKGVYQYLSTVDTGWKLTLKPILTDTNAIVDYCYTKTGHSWYMPETYHLMVTRTYGPPVQNGVIYGFKELDLWTSYIGQMNLMNATKIGTIVQGGGTRTFYTVNDIAFMLIDFPPGVQGPERTYQVTIMTAH
ncbi:MAG TPA: hypothetical protein VNW51_00090 [Mucilaginibacter sp.]|jgi:hypothetical protein|nr:hypothetical protein [Mucilaginibacter sp.]